MIVSTIIPHSNQNPSFLDHFSCSITSQKGTTFFVLEHTCTAAMKKLIIMCICVASGPGSVANRER